MTPRGPRRQGHRHPDRPFATALVATMLAIPLVGCSAFTSTAPGCRDPLRLAIIAQSLPSASYLPCIRQLPQGWNTSGFAPTQAGTAFLLNSDRSPGRPVQVSLTATCKTAGASPSPPRAPGVLTYTRIRSLSPRFAGSLYDVFPGGCIRYRFNFTLGPHIALMEQFEGAVGLYPRQQLRLVLKRQLGVELSP